MDEEQRAKQHAEAMERMRPQRKWEAENGSPRPMTCPYCETERVRSRDWDDFGGGGMGIRVHQPKGKTMAELHGEITVVDEHDNVQEFYCEHGHRWRMHATANESPRVLIYDRWDVVDGPATGVRRVIHLVMPPQRKGDIIFTPLKMACYDDHFRVELELEVRLPSPDIGHSPHSWVTARDDIGNDYEPNTGLSVYHRDDEFSMGDDQAMRMAMGVRLAKPLLQGGSAEGVWRLTDKQVFVPTLSSEANTLFVDVSALGLGRWGWDADTQRQHYVLQTTIDGPWSFAIPLPPMEEPG